MPGKSQRKKAKYSSQIKKRKTTVSRPAAAVQEQTAAKVREPAPLPKASTSSGTPAMAKLAAVQRPYISTELRTIGIIAGIMLIILIVLGIVLS